jgi:hypothetical protein
MPFFWRQLVPAVAVTGISDICVTELVVNATRARSARSEERAA